MKQPSPRVLLIGWDAADWKVLNPLIDQGLMPNLERLIDGGVMGRMATLDPPLSPTLWTSIATGKRPYKHGIHGFAEPDPSGEGIRPINVTSRKVKAIWNILNQHGLKTNVVGWWPSHPAEPVNGVYLSDFYHRANGRLGAPWPMLPGTVHPPELTDLFAALRIHPEELTGAHLLPFVPEAEKIDQHRDRRLFAVAKILAECATVHAAATYVMEHTAWDFMAVYYDAIDHFCHGFMKYHPPRREHIPPADYALYNGVVAAGCRFHDMMLGRLLALAGEDTTVLLLSDHGFYPDHNRPRAIPREPAGPAVEHSPYGIFVMKGPGIRRDDTVFGASLLDVTPTLLALYGLPVGEDMDGKVLLHAFETPPEIETIKSWEDVPGADGSHGPGFTRRDEDTRAELQQLIDLGYVEDPGENVAVAVQRIRNENDFYLARAYLNGGALSEGISLLESLHAAAPETVRYATYLIHAYQSVGRYKDARRLVDHVRAVQDRETPGFDILEGTLLLAEQRYRKALVLFQKAESEGGDQPQLHLRIALAYLQMGRLEDAERAVLKEQALNPEEAHAPYLLGRIRYQQMRYEEAFHAFMKAVSLLYYFPAAHYYLGETLVQLGRYEHAVEAFDVTLRLAPGLNAARQQLAHLYERHLGRPEEAHRYRHDLQHKLNGTVTVVSGLPRAGTSMVMQMLEAGGMDLFTDRERAADENNPKGYYEHAAVKRLKHDKKWLPQAVGKAVKVVAQLLPHLPMNYRYQMLFVERDVLEVVVSQQHMLARNGKRSKDDPVSLNLVLRYNDTLKKIKEWAESQPNVEILYLQHRAVVEAPHAEAARINDFLGGSLAVEAMAGVVDARLYRTRR